MQGEASLSRTIGIAIGDRCVRVFNPVQVIKVVRGPRQRCR